MLDHANGLTEQIDTHCCVVGGGPAGMMLGFLLARSGVDTIVLEKHRDFLRDFRGDTIHPSTLDVLGELGLLDEFLRRPHQELRQLRMSVRGRNFLAADLAILPTRCKFIAFMPQWDFLDFIATKAKRYPCFDLRMEAEATDLIFDADRVRGVQATTPNGRLEVRADLVVGADGRNSIVREKAGLAVQEFGVPIDVLWTRIPKTQGSGEQTLGFFDAGRFMVLIDRGEYFQCGFIIPKGKLDEIKQGGLEAFRADIVTLAPFLRDHVAALQDWDQVKLLTVKIDRLERWYRPGLLCIGDAAHAMSPAGGVGINLAIQDAVATANVLAVPLRQSASSVEGLARVQRRRELPTRLFQAIQSFIHGRTFGAGATPPSKRGLGIVIWLFDHVPLLRWLVALLTGIGFRPEHVRTPSIPQPLSPSHGGKG
jgi:2-polyprenyl-6-methoxyphenol hydroxylase-like FAD-dependent oxidoreductase